MYELIKVVERTYYIDCPAKIGIYKCSDNEVYIIDSGNDKDAGKKILKILAANNWQLKGIINTHSHADHVGGNALIQQRTGCDIYGTPIENIITKYTFLESALLYSGYTCKPLHNKFLMAMPSNPTYDITQNCPEGLEYIKLPGHYMDMIGIRTSDDIIFLADSIFGENTINKYHFFFIYDVKGYLETLDMIENMKAKLFIPSHASQTEDIKPLVKINRDKIYEIINVILEICIEKISYEDILKKIFDKYSLNMTFDQYVLVGSTVKSYLSYLYDKGDITYTFEGNRMLWNIQK